MAVAQEEDFSDGHLCWLGLYWVEGGVECFGRQGIVMGKEWICTYV